MYHLFQDLSGFALQARDNVVGNIHDVYFDDQNWTMRYLVANTGTWLFGREVLISAHLLGKPDLRDRNWPVDLTREQVENAATPHEDPPVSQQEKRPLLNATLSPFLIAPPDGAYSPIVAEQHLAMEAERQGHLEEAGEHDPYLRSMSEVQGYAISAEDGEIGSVVDFLIDPETQKVQYLVVDTGAWLPGKQVVASTDWVNAVNWSARTISVSVGKSDVEESPEVDDLHDVKRDELMMIHSHYGMPMV